MQPRARKHSATADPLAPNHATRLGVYPGALPANCWWPLAVSVQALGRMTVLCCWVGLATTLFCLAPAGASATDLDDFQRARRAYELGTYARAVELFEVLVVVEPPRLTSGPLLLESRKYLGASYLFVGRGADAEHQFEALLEEDASYEIDPLAFPREVQRVFGAVRERFLKQRQARAREHQLAQARARKQEVRRLEEERAQRSRLLELAQTEWVVHEHSRWLALLPSGVGQFQNGHVALGQVLAVGEGALLAANLVSFALWKNVESQRDQGKIDPSRRADAERVATIFRFTNQASFVLLALAAIAGVVDAQVRFEPSTTERRRRPLPPDLRLGLRSPFGLGLAPGRFMLHSHFSL